MAQYLGLPSRMIRPFTLGADQIVSTNAVDPTPEWAASTPYARDAIVHQGDRVYISRITDNTGNDPANGDSTKWIDNGPINPLAMFDGETSTQTEAEGEIAVELQLPGWLNSMAVFDVVGTAMHVVVTDGANEVFNETRSLLDDEPIVDFYSYLFEELNYVRDLALMDIPPTPNATLAVTIAGGGTVKCGALVAGSALVIGSALQGSSAGIENFSVVERNPFGTLFITSRNTAKEGSFDVIVPDGRGPAINNAFRDLASRVAVFVMAENDSRAVILGFIRSYKFTWGQPNNERLSLDIEGVT